MTGYRVPEPIILTDSIQIEGFNLPQDNLLLRMIASVSAVVYGVIALLTTGTIASEGVNKGGEVYDDTAITMGLVLGLIWPITILAFLIEPILISLGRVFS